MVVQSLAVYLPETPLESDQIAYFIHRPTLSNEDGPDTHTTLHRVLLLLFVLCGGVVAVFLEVALWLYEKTGVIHLGGVFLEQVAGHELVQIAVLLDHLVLLQLSDDLQGTHSTARVARSRVVVPVPDDRHTIDETLFIQEVLVIPEPLGQVCLGIDLHAVLVFRLIEVVQHLILVAVMTAGVLGVGEEESHPLCGG